jgi:hypothetical protein
VYNSEREAKKISEEEENFYNMLYEMPEPPEDYEFYDLWKKQQDPYSTYVGSKIIPCIVQ